MKTETKIATAFAAAALAALMGTSAYVNRITETATLVVVDKERLMSVSSSDGTTSTEYKNFVYTADETYRVKDNIWLWHFRAATVYAKIPETGVCEVTLSGLRSGFLSWNQNIIAADCVATTEEKS